MTWKQLGRTLRTVFLLRVPVLTLLLLAGFAFVALFPAKTLLGNLFDERVFQLSPTGVLCLREGWTAWYLFSISFTAFLTAFTAVTVINLILHYGHYRFEDPALALDQKRPLITFFLGVLAALPVVVGTAFHSRANQLHMLSPGPKPYVLWLMPALGLLSALVLVLLAKIVQLAFTDPKTTRHPPPYLIFPVYKIHSLERLFDKLYCWRGKSITNVKGVVNRTSQWPLEILRCAGQGYLNDCEAPPGSLSLRSGHVFGLALSLMAIGTYLGIGYFKGKIDANPTIVPALAFLLLFGLVLCWTLGALTFFLDRYRVPLLTGVGLLSLLTIFVAQSDHVYRVENAPMPTRSDPAELVQQRTNNGKQRIILVATAGGGIQAAAWTARVLRGLEEECETKAGPGNEPRCDFRKSVVLISGVSGGSLGAIAYARSFTDVPTIVDPRDVPYNAAQPALDEVAWAWMNPDVGRAVLPWFRTQFVDRGWALEEKWSAVNQTYVPPESWLQKYMLSSYRKDTFLGDWAGETRAGTMPSLLLNATLAEQGQPVVFSTTTFPHKNDPRGLINFYDLYEGHDIRVTTAARLSASFPYVAPAARANAKATTVGDQHIVDGGYYDNYGVDALLGWLQDAVESPLNNPHAVEDVLILQIRPFGEDPLRAPPVKGWGYQLVAPVDALLDVRDTGQSARDRTELALFTRAFKGKPNIWRADFFYPSNLTKDCADAPLSWKLSIEQTNCILDAWTELRAEDLKAKNGRIACVVGYLQNKQIAGQETPSGKEVICKAGDDLTP